MDSEQKHILLIDDDKWIHVYLTNALEGLNYKITCASDPLKGLNIAINERPDIIMLDIVLPNMNGDLFLHILKNIDVVSQIPVIILSSHLDAAIIARTYKSGAAAFITKPASKYTFIDKISEILFPKNNTDVDFRKSPEINN